MGKLYKLIISMVILITTTISVGCSSNKHDISDYFSYEISGYEENLKVNIDFNLEGFLREELELGNVEQLIKQDSYFIKVLPVEDPSKLKNGDTLKLKIEYDEKFYKKELGVKLINSKDTIQIKGLPKEFKNKTDLTVDIYNQLKKETDEFVVGLIQDGNLGDLDDLDIDGVKGITIHDYDYYFDGVYFAKDSNNKTGLVYRYLTKNTTENNFLIDNSMTDNIVDGITTYSVHITNIELPDKLTDISSIKYKIDSDRTNGKLDLSQINLNSSDLEYNQSDYLKELDELNRLIDKKEIKLAELKAESLRGKLTNESQKLYKDACSRLSKLKTQTRKEIVENYVKANNFKFIRESSGYSYYNKLDEDEYQIGFLEVKNRLRYDVYSEKYLVEAYFSDQSQLPYKDPKYIILSE